MRLDDFDPNIKVSEGSGGGRGLGGGGGMLLGLLPMVFSRFGCGGVVVLLAIMFFVGGNPLNLIGGGSSPTSQSASTPAGGGNATQICSTNPDRKAACDAFSSADKTWAAVFQQSGKTFEQPALEFYDQSDTSGCGAAQSAMGPFYCPTDQTIYLDTSFFNELSQQYGAKGDFAQDYVIAHEFGHHIQQQLGTSDQVQREMRQSSSTAANQLSVKLELQADCYAGVWAGLNRDRMDPGDLEEGLTAAQAIGDDTLQKQSQGRVMPDSFTHGTSAERTAWLRRGVTTADPSQCDTFSGSIDI
ncbi:zinc metalloprotease [Sphingomonas koreensis]|nr:zinc metalloprotease [Sphingomonas koreensis]